MQNYFPLFLYSPFIELLTKQWGEYFSVSPYCLTLKVPAVCEFCLNGASHTPLNSRLVQSNEPHIMFNLSGTETTVDSLVHRKLLTNKLLQFVFLLDLHSSKYPSKNVHNIAAPSDLLPSVTFIVASTLILFSIYSVFLSVSPIPYF